MTKRTRVTMADVARAAQVTSQTVSRAFRNTPDVSEETRERILKIAAELNYVMNNTASSLRGGNSRQIVVVYDNLVNVYFSIMIDYLQSSLRERGYSILVLSLSSSRLDRSAYEFAVSHNAAGIVTFLEPEEEIGEMIENFRIPVLALGRRTQVKGVDSLRTDDVEGGRLAARRLLGRGARRLLYLSVGLSVTCAYDRFEGFKEEAIAAGLGIPVVVDDPSSFEERLVALFSDPATAPDGIFCFNDMIAFDALYFLELHKIAPVPTVGYDCVQEELHIPHRLTSVSANKRALAARAAEMIVGQIESDREGSRHEVFEVALFRGATA